MNRIIKKIRIVDLEKPDLTQSRVGTDKATIEDYKRIWECKDVPADFPPIIVYQSGDKYYIADGFHRVQSLMLAELDRKVEHRTIDCEVRQGTFEDAIGYSLGANLRNGLRPSTADKKRAILLYYSLNADNCRRSNNYVAQVCGTSHTFVGTWKTTTLNTPIVVTAAETNIPKEILKTTIANLHAARNSGEIVAVRGGKELKQKERKTSIDPTVNRHHHYIFPEPHIGFNIARGTIVSGFESLTNTGMLALASGKEHVLIPESSVIRLPYPIGQRVASIEDGTEVTIQGYKIVGTDLKIEAVDDNGYKHSGSINFYQKPLIKKILENPESTPDIPENNKGDIEESTPPMLDLTKLNNSQLVAIVQTIQTELDRRTQNTPDLTIR